MTQPEPTRDPRLLSAAELANYDNLLLLHAFSGQPVKCETWVADVQKFKSHIAAQDQRHAALVEAATELLSHYPHRYGPLGAVRTKLDAALAALAQPPGDE